MRIGLDLGGTKIEGIALDEDGTELGRRRVPTPRDDYEGTLHAMAGLVRELEAGAGRRATVGVGMPGALSPATGLVKNANSTWLIGRALDRDLSARLDRPVRFANDANCFALSEAVDGAAAGARVVFGVIVGTGTGGGVVVDRRAITGRNAIAGEWGHNPLPWPGADEWPGPACYCGKTGCVETFLSGPGLARDHREAGGDDVAAPEIVARAERGEERAGAALGRYERRMARALAVVLNVLDPDVVVLGGGLSRVARLY
jgi:fructokinase